MKWSASIGMPPIGPGIPENDKVLWLSGDPGSGKSVLASAVFQKLSSEDQLVAMFIFSDQERPQSDEPGKDKVIFMLRGIAMQLIKIHETRGSLPTEFLRLYREESRYKLNDNTAEMVVKALINTLPRIHIIVDGLNESHDRLLLVRVLKSLVGAKTVGLVKWLFTSRTEVEFVELFCSLRATGLEVNAEHTYPDVWKFVEARWQDLHQNEDLICHGSLTKFRRYLHGCNFLGAQLTMELLSREEGITCEDELQEVLDGYNHGFNRVYIPILTRLAAQSENDRNLAR